MGAISCTSCTCSEQPAKHEVSRDIADLAMCEMVFEKESTEGTQRMSDAARVELMRQQARHERLAKSHHFQGGNAIAPMKLDAREADYVDEELQKSIEQHARLVVEQHAEHHAKHVRHHINLINQHSRKCHGRLCGDFDRGAW